MIFEKEVFWAYTKKILFKAVFTLIREVDFGKTITKTPGFIQTF
jgi:hypothetical protein